METLKKITSSWVVVVISFIVWPVGFVFLYMKLFFDGGKLKANKVFSWILAVFCCLMIFGGINVMAEKGKPDVMDIFLAILFLAGTILFTIKAVKLGKEYKYYKTYVDAIGIKRNISIEELAEKTNNSIETVTEDISKMVSYKMIKGYINEENEFISSIEEDDVTVAINADTRVKPKVVLVKCKNCGAENKYIEEKENKCEFCGSILENSKTPVN